MVQTLDPTNNPLHAIYWLWALWYASWLASTVWTARPSARPDMRAHISNQLATVIGVLLLFDTPLLNGPWVHLWALPVPAVWTLSGLIVLAFAFCWWARIEMGRLWSGMVSRTENHRIIDTGPFALVRHPIYSGIVLAALLTATAQGRSTGFAGAALLLLGFWLKARLEERFLTRELGGGAYDAYRRRVPMLLPFGPKSA